MLKFDIDDMFSEAAAANTATAAENILTDITEDTESFDIIHSNDGYNVMVLFSPVSYDNDMTAEEIYSKDYKDKIEYILDSFSDSYGIKSKVLLTVKQNLSQSSTFLNFSDKYHVYVKSD